MSSALLGTYPVITDSDYLDNGRYTVNSKCAFCLDKVVAGSMYELYHYQLNEALTIALMQFTYECIEMVLAYNVADSCFDGRFSRDNIKWAMEVIDKKYNEAPNQDGFFEQNTRVRMDFYGADMSTHRAILNGLVNHFRKL